MQQKKVKRLFLKVIYTFKTTANGRSQKPRNNTDFEEKPQFFNHSDNSDLTAKTAIVFISLFKRTTVKFYNQSFNHSDSSEDTAKTAVVFISLFKRKVYNLFLTTAITAFRGFGITAKTAINGQLSQKPRKRTEFAIY